LPFFTLCDPLIDSAEEFKALLDAAIARRYSNSNLLFKAFTSAERFSSLGFRKGLPEYLELAHAPIS